MNFAKAMLACICTMGIITSCGGSKNSKAHRELAHEVYNELDNNSRVFAGHVAVLLEYSLTSPPRGHGANQSTDALIAEAVYSAKKSEAYRSQISDKLQEAILSTEALSDKIKVLNSGEFKNSALIHELTEASILLSRISHSARWGPDQMPYVQELRTNMDLIREFRDHMQRANIHMPTEDDD